MIMLISLLFLSFGKKSTANPIVIPSYEYGGLLPVNGTSEIEFQMASVMLEIDVEKKKNITLDFSANYTFFNPNSTTSLLIGLPLFILFVVPLTIIFILKRIKKE